MDVKCGNIEHLASPSCLLGQPQTDSSSCEYYQVTPGCGGPNNGWGPDLVDQCGLLNAQLAPNASWPQLQVPWKNGPNISVPAGQPSNASRLTCFVNTVNHENADNTESQRALGIFLTALLGTMLATMPVLGYLTAKVEPKLKRYGMGVGLGVCAGAIGFPAGLILNLTLHPNISDYSSGDGKWMMPAGAALGVALAAAGFYAGHMARRSQPGRTTAPISLDLLNSLSA